MNFNNLKHKVFALISLLLVASFSQAVTYKFKNVKVNLTIGDITKQKVGAVVNAANAKLRGGSGVCGAIFKAAGKDKLQHACNKYHADKHGKRCQVGHAKITRSFGLSKNGVKYIIHAVGPDCRKVKKPAERYELLRSSYANSLKLASQRKLKSIAFPFISSAVFACPKDFGAKTAARAIKRYLRHHRTSLKEIRLVLFSNQDYQIMKKAFNQVF